MGTPSEGSPRPLFLPSTPPQGKEAANSVRWPVEFVDGAPRFSKSVNSAQNHFSLHGEADLIRPGDTDTAVIPQQVCFSTGGICERGKEHCNPLWVLFLQPLGKFSLFSNIDQIFFFLKKNCFSHTLPRRVIRGSKLLLAFNPCPHISISRAPTAGLRG